MLKKSTDSSYKRIGLVRSRLVCSVLFLGQERLERWSSSSRFIHEAGFCCFSDGWSFLPPDPLQVRLSSSRGLGRSFGRQSGRGLIYASQFFGTNGPPDADMKGSVSRRKIRRGHMGSSGSTTGRQARARANRAKMREREPLESRGALCRSTMGGPLGTLPAKPAYQPTSP